MLLWMCITKYNITIINVIITINININTITITITRGKEQSQILQRSKDQTPSQKVQIKIAAEAKRRNNSLGTQ